MRRGEGGGLVSPPRGPRALVCRWLSGPRELRPACPMCPVPLCAVLRCSALGGPSASGASVAPADSARATRHTAQTAVKKAERPQAWTPGRSPKELHRR